jgi:hypothetical protein
MPYNILLIRIILITLLQNQNQKFENKNFSRKNLTKFKKKEKIKFIIMKRITSQDFQLKMYFYGILLYSIGYLLFSFNFFDVSLISKGCSVQIFGIAFVMVSVVIQGTFFLLFFVISLFIAKESFGIKLELLFTFLFTLFPTLIGASCAAIAQYDIYVEGFLFVINNRLFLCNKFLFNSNHYF